MSECIDDSSRPFWREADRLAALRSFGILDTGPEAVFDDIATIAAEICDTPIAAVNFIDGDRQWSKAIVGSDIRQTALDASICAHAIHYPDLFVVPDTRRDPRFYDICPVTPEPGLCFYAGVVLATEKGLPLGTLCVADTRPRPQGVTQRQAKALRALARTILREMMSRRNNMMLAERETALAAIIDALPQMAWIAGPDGRHEYRNRRYYDFTGATPGSIDNDGWNTVAHPEDRERAWIRWCHSIRTGKAYEAEYRVRHHSGEFRWLLARAIPDYNEQGQIARWLGTATDIHEQKQATEALRTSEERLRLAIETTSLGIWDADLLTGNREWTREARDVLGISPETPATRDTFLDRIHPEDRTRIGDRFFAAVPENELAYRDECRIIRADTGEVRWVAASGRTFLDSAGRAIRKLGTIQDITERKRAEEALRDSETRLRLALDTTFVGIWDADVITGDVQWSPETRQILGVGTDTPATHANFLERIHPDDRAHVANKPYVEVPGKGLSYSGTYRIVRADSGEERWVAASGRTILDATGNVIRKIGTIQDITERKQADDALRDSEARLQLALQAARMVAWELDTRTDQITRSENSLALLGLKSGPAEDFLERMRPEDRARREEFLANIRATGADMMEFRYFLLDGRSLWLGTRAQKAGPHRVVGVTFDITDRKAAEEEIWRAANHDPLTGLPNRALLQQRLDLALKDALEKGTSVSLLLIDLDNFKDVNDSFGHAAGDALLKETAARLSDMMRECDTVARLGGDEFAVIVVEPLKVGNAISLADSIMQRIRQPFAHEGRMIGSRVSIGVAAFPEHDCASAELMKDADIALYRAKAEGRGRAVTYSATMRVAAEQRLALVKEVREALRRKEFMPFYQPKVCLSTRRIVGLEALARWQHPVKGILTPATFGVAFDDPELAVVLSKRLIGKIVSDIRKWLTAGIDPGRVAINFSSLEFSQPDLADDVLHVFDLAKIPAKHLEIEVTEKVLLEGRSELVSETLEKFRRHGVQIALDDFGTGYASLTHLKQFPVSHIKIDQSFVRDLECDPEDRAIVEAVIGLAENLNLQVTAEGVETEGQVRQLREMRCHNAQGYLFARPMAAAGVAEFLASQNGPTAVP